ncbi:MAG: deoxynucleoside kinase [Bacteroidales bacterium]|jgi:deoxyadenosine/deoxycytidine kinase|nr:deoxynucleoside kinase [Bacteroidales bacterium]MBQ4478069.1 deoxynucleoside kinase [Bacteroidales bacterium]MBR4453208.1 deoxynucleoside kinase [Bacteroidales bacterium]
MYIAVAGNIGSGKTTLTNLLSRHFNWYAAYENIENNPYLVSFYEDMQRWSFNIQIFYLNMRFKQMVELQKMKKPAIQDRTVYEDAYIFAPNLHDMGLMATRDYENYLSMFELVNSFIKAPDLLIYLRASTSTLVQNIQKRGRKYENTIRLDYLQNLNERYEQWISNYDKGKLMIIDTDVNRFDENPDALGNILNDVSAEFFGLFNEQEVVEEKTKKRRKK